MSSASRWCQVVAALVVCMAMLPFGALDVAAALEPTTAFHGTVRDSGTSTPIEGAIVTASYEEDEFTVAEWVYTDAAGHYEISVPAGTWDLTVNANTYASATQLSVSYNGVNAVATDFNLQRYPIAFVGQVKNAGGTALSGAVVRAISEDPAKPLDVQTTAGADGSYELRLPVGTYELIATMPGHAPHAMTGQVFSGGQLTRNFSLQPYPLAITGTVTDAQTSAKVAGARVRAVYLSAAVFVEDVDYTDSNGAYSLHLPAGTYSMTVTRTGYTGQELSGVAFNGTSTAFQNFALEPRPDDTTAPVTTISGVPAWAKDDVTFTLSATDAGGSGVESTHYDLGSGEEDYLGNDGVTVTGEGITPVRYWSIDAAGNRESDKTATIRIDRTVPVTTSNAVARYVNTATVKFAASDQSGSGVKATRHRWGTSGAWKTGDAKISTVGVHTLQYYSEDNAGNAEQVKQVVLSVASAMNLSAKASPSVPSKYGASSRLSGYLRKGSSTGTGVGGQTVRVQKKTDGVWVTVKTLTTSSSGYVYWDTVVRSKAEFRLFYQGKAGAFEPKTSATIAVTPKAYLGKVSGKRVATRKYKLSGVLKPRHTAGTKPVRVYLWRKVGSSWKSAGYIKASASNYSSYSKYSVTYKFSKKGSWRLRAVHPADAGHAKSYSVYSYLTVK